LSVDPTQHEIWLRRQALLVVSLLPENSNDALRTLEYASQLMHKFILVQASENPQKQCLMRIVPKGYEPDVLPLRDAADQ
jgi:hypothetical protein